MEEAYSEAGELRTARQDSIPSDSILPTGAERGLYDRVIEKGSRTVERFPKNERQVPKAVFMMAEAFRYKSEWRKAVEKYDELERYFPQYDSMPKAEYERAYCLFKNEEYALSRFSAERILEQGESHKFYLPTLELFSLLQEHEGLPQDAIASLEAVLASDFGTPWTRARARLRLADLYYEQKKFDKAREHYLHNELAILPTAERYKAKSNAAECLISGGKSEESDKNNSKETAATEYKGLADSVSFKDYKNISLTRQGEILLSLNNPQGIFILQTVAHNEPKTEIAARAFFGIGDFRQQGRDYPDAILQYDSSFQNKPSSSWGKDSYSRKNALLKLLKLKDSVAVLQKDKKTFFPQEFQIAELFLFKLSETDSALALLAKMDSSLTDSNLKARAAYTRAFIYDEFKKDTAKAFQIYIEIIAAYPQSTYAKQAQKNMGEQVSVKTEEDLARDKFLEAETAWLAGEYETAIAIYDSVAANFPQTQTAIQANFAKASILADYLGDPDSARVIFGKLSRENYKTPWGKAAQEKISGKLLISESDLQKNRKRVEQLENSIATQSKKYYDDSEQKQNAPAPPPKIADDEILQNDYNSLYDFK
ncbi:hypothetical protein AGMMS49938_05030 [Fibrobacterales bacterium]|nr:hypothetical protein AGMMS49938_05030 [Fibrobacterales bacterium]